MYFLADENFPLASTQLLIANNHVVQQVALHFQSKPDNYILILASINNQIILTFDKDFGELIFKEAKPATCGVVLFRLKNYFPITPAIILIAALNSEIRLNNFLTVIDENKIRQRPIK